MEKRIMRNLILLAFALVSVASYAYDFQSGGLTYTIKIDKGGVEVAGLSPTAMEGTVNIPATVTTGAAWNRVISGRVEKFSVSSIISS